MRANGIFQKIVTILEQSREDQVIAFSAAAFLYFLLRDSTNSEYVSEECGKV